MPTTREDVGQAAAMFGWEVRSNGTYLKGDTCLQVDYSKSGHILTAARYRFYKVDELHLVDRAGGKNKKSEVVSWMAS